jgi:hypothetical protein
MITLPFQHFQEKEEYKQWRGEISSLIKHAYTILKSEPKTFEEHMKNFNLTKEEAEFCVNRGKKLREEYSLLPKILIRDITGKIDWRTTKRRVDGMNARIDNIVSDYFTTLKPYLTKQKEHANISSNYFKNNE